MAARKLAAGNWKMNGVSASLAEIEALEGMLTEPACDVLICPPATLVRDMVAAVSKIAVGGQDCHPEKNGAHTGEISADMLVDAGARYVILGHSERRTDHAESSELVRSKARAAIEAGLKAIICVGETLAEREASNTLDIIGGQLAGSVPDLVNGENLVIAYEPVWAIGTGLTPTLAQIGEVHDFIRARLIRRFGDGVGLSVPILYGGSVKAANANEIFGVSNVDGALVGGASLKAADFAPIVAALSAG